MTRRACDNAADERVITLWGRRNSLCTQRVLWCMDEIGLDYELILASAIFGPSGHIWKGGEPYGIVDRPDYRAMNPNGTVPTIDDGGTIVWESNAILSYLALAYAPCLFGDDPRVFGRSNSWMGWCNARFEGPLGDATMHLSRLPPEQRRPEKLRIAEKHMVAVLEMIDGALAANDFIAGDRLTIGDISLAPFVQRWYHYELSNPPAPYVENWLERLADRDAYRRHVAPRHLHIDTD